MASITVRPASIDDTDLIIALIKALAEYERDPDAAVATPELIHRHIFGVDLAPHERGPIAECLIGELDGSPQGFAIFFHNYSSWVGKPGIYLEDLFVRPEARGVGLGKALLRRVAQIAVERECERVDWLVIDWNAPAIDFYKSIGARPLSDWTNFRLEGPHLQALGG
jgi:GNAT superfamily N-acetyltransferase